MLAIVVATSLLHKWTGKRGEEDFIGSDGESKSEFDVGLGSDIDNSDSNNDDDNYNNNNNNRVPMDLICAHLCNTVARTLSQRSAIAAAVAVVSVSIGMDTETATTAAACVCAARGLRKRERAALARHLIGRVRRLHARATDLRRACALVR